MKTFIFRHKQTGNEIVIKSIDTQSAYKELEKEHNLSDYILMGSQG
jgi:hypothetical protein